MPQQANVGLGNRFRTKMQTTQIPVALGASGTFANNGSNLCTLTFTAAHGLTLNPAAGVMPNYFFTLTGAASEAGGEMNSNIFRILGIPSTTTVQFYSTLTAATVTGASLIPVFFVPFTAMLANYGNTEGPVDSAGKIWPPAQLNGNAALIQLGANCTWKVNTDYPSTAVILDQYTTPSSGTPTTAPTWATQVPASSNALVYGDYQECLWASGAAGTSTASVYN